MTTLAKATVATRELVGGLEHRVGGKRRLYIMVGIVGAIVLLLLLRSIGGAKKAPPAPPPRVVVVAQVISKDVPLYLNEIGTCAAVESVQVKAQVSGQITSRNFQDGAEVKKGELLFVIDSRPYEAALAQAQAQFAQAQSQMVLDEITLKRQQELRARGVTSPQDFDVAQGTVNNDKAKMQGAQGAVAAAQLNLDYCNIRSPIDGRAGLRAVDVGNLVTGGNSGGAVLLTIERFDQIYTDFTVAENDLGMVRRYLGHPNMKVETDSPNDDQPARLGDLYFIDNVVQAGSGTVKARAITPNPERSLWPGQFVRVRFILDTLKDAKLVPARAVQISQRGPFIFVLKPDNTVDQRPVKPGQRQDGDLMVIEEGLKTGETVVVTGQLALAPGSKVAPQTAESPSKLETGGRNSM